MTGKRLDIMYVVHLQNKKTKKKIVYTNLYKFEMKEKEQITS